MPEECQAISLHKHIQTSKTFFTVNFVPTRSIWIKTTQGILQTYADEDGNVIFQDQFLEEITHEQMAIVAKTYLKFVIEKFDGKSSSAYQWIEIFEKECARFGIVKEEEKN
ncbi:hypothetical protein K1T71_012613 [Dendrolimus kikuchii]|uniref:Uncharacterized protein n=1 Tax=Dendrolimus kikuchii TaxID=765133 RepID=A0ACC1CK15_9NEOP|nr:hypothetical protein K1T71_012613 [Dendrolimus kikuchii]